MIKMMEPNKCEIERLVQIKRVQNQSKHTIGYYERYLGELSDFLGKPFKDATEQDIFAFVSFKAETCKSEKTLTLYKMVVKAFYKFLYGMENEYPTIVRNLKTNGRHNGNGKVVVKPKDVLTKEDIANLVKHCRHYREEAIVAVLYESGCRIGEFIGMNIGHLIDHKHGKILVVSGKTGERRILLVESVPYLNKWLEHHPMKDNPNAPLWCSLIPPHERVLTATIQCVLRELKKASGIRKKMNPHNFRHSRATFLSRFMSDAQMRVYFGWVDASEMVGLYTHLSGKDTDSTILKSSGIVDNEEVVQVSPLQEKDCSRCHSKNAGTNEFCGLCGKPFNENVLEIDIQDQTLRDSGIGKYLDELVGKMETLQKKVEELEAKQA
jgi:site-specific recombinase XerD